MIVSNLKIFFMIVSNLKNIFYDYIQFKDNFSPIKFNKPTLKWADR